MKGLLVDILSSIHQPDRMYELLPDPLSLELTDADPPTVVVSSLKMSGLRSKSWTRPAGPLKPSKATPIRGVGSSELAPSVFLAAPPPTVEVSWRLYGGGQPQIRLRRVLSASLIHLRGSWSCIYFAL